MREKGQTEVAKTLETPVFSRGIEILTEKEEFLRRLEHSDYAENLVLKGGLFIYTFTGFDSRVPMDNDFLLRQMINNKFIEESRCCNENY